MNFSAASFERHAGLILAATATALALYLTSSALRPAFWPGILLAAGFGAAIVNVIYQDQSRRALSAADLLLVAATGFAALAADAPSLRDEAISAMGRMIFLGGAVGTLAFAYAHWRDQPGISAGDIKLIAVLGASLPLVMSIYAVAIACCTAVLFAAVRGRGTLSARQHVPAASVIAGTFYLVWLGYRLAL